MGPGAAEARRGDLSASLDKRTLRAGESLASFLRLLKQGIGYFEPKRQMTR